MRSLIGALEGSWRFHRGAQFFAVVRPTSVRHDSPSTGIPTATDHPGGNYRKTSGIGREEASSIYGDELIALGNGQPQPDVSHGARAGPITRKATPSPAVMENAPPLRTGRPSPPSCSCPADITTHRSRDVSACTSIYVST